MINKVICSEIKIIYFHTLFNIGVIGEPQLNFQMYTFVPLKGDTQKTKCVYDIASFCNCLKAKFEHSEICDLVLIIQNLHQNLWPISRITYFKTIFFSCLTYLLQYSKNHKERLCKSISPNPGGIFQLTIWRISTKCMTVKWNKLAVRWYAVTESLSLSWFYEKIKVHFTLRRLENTPGSSRSLLLFLALSWKTHLFGVILN